MDSKNKKCNSATPIFDEAQSYFLHQFDPCKGFPKRTRCCCEGGGPEPVMFVKGKYVDLHKASGKDKNTLYFGTSQKTDLLSGVWLGDYELTSKVRDVSVVGGPDGSKTFIIKFINDEGKLQTLKTTVASASGMSDMYEKLSALVKDATNTVQQIEKKLIVADASLVKINDVLSSITNDLNSGKYDYSIGGKTSDFANGYKQTFFLKDGNGRVKDSSLIEVNDFVLQDSKFDAKTNELTLISMPSKVSSQSIYKKNGVILTAEDIKKIEKKYGSSIDKVYKEIGLTKESLKSEYVKKTKVSFKPLADSIKNQTINIIVNDSSTVQEITEAIVSDTSSFTNLTESISNSSTFVQNINYEINTNSSINDRVVVVESQLLWENA